MKYALIAIASAGTMLAGDVTTLSRDAEKEAWVRATLARLGLNNEIRVVRDDGLSGSTTCAYASIRGGLQYVAYDPQCVTTLAPEDENYWWSAGVMLHEIAHHLGAHTATSGKPTIERETEAERWVGWAFRYSGVTLGQALVYARNGPRDASATHPGLAERRKAVESGWRSANAQLAGASTANLPATFSGANAEKLAEAARRHLKTLGRE